LRSLDLSAFLERCVLTDGRLYAPELLLHVGNGVSTAALVLGDEAITQVNESAASR